MSAGQSIGSKFTMRTWLLVACVLALSGCAAMLLGGGNSDGTQLGRDTRSQAQVSTDGAVTTAVRDRISGDSILGRYRLHVETFNNVVTLHGTVGSYDARDRAVRLARAVNGVTQVESRIRVAGGT
jgi:hyperosmotically inducible periplasmic protein